MDKDEEKPMNRWGAPQEDDGLIHLNDLDFDFDDYFSRSAAGELTDGEREEYKARVIGLFCHSVFTSDGDMGKVPFWIANYLAEALHQVLGGVPWNKVLGTPFDPYQSDFTPQGDRAMAIYCNVENARRANPEANITTFIAAEAALHNVSYETARGDYYAIRKGIQMRTGIPERFLKQIPDF